MADIPTLRAWGLRALPWLVPVLLLGAAVASLALDARHGLRPLAELGAESRAARERVDALQAERVRLIAWVQGLRDDPRALEVAAREALGVVRPGEILVRMPSSQRRLD